jgi:hypothetical protein
LVMDCESMVNSRVTLKQVHPVLQPPDKTAPQLPSIIATLLAHVLLVSFPFLSHFFISLLFLASSPVNSSVKSPGGFHYFNPGICEYITLHCKRDFQDVG